MHRSALLVAMAIISCGLAASAHQADSQRSALPQCPDRIVYGKSGHRWYYEVNGDRITRPEVKRLLRAEPACARSYRRHALLILVPWLIVATGASMSIANLALTGDEFTAVGLAGDGLMSVGPVFTVDLRRTLKRAIDDYNRARCGGVSYVRRTGVDGEATDTLQITGRVLEVHMLGKTEETVTVCHPDPRYVVSVQTQSRVEKLAIHSPAIAFAGADPVGRTYRFYLSKSGSRFLLRKTEVTAADTAPATR